jgi:DNA end-binding protein Ku
MDARAIASLTISFGLVAIPVKLYSATHSSGRISFNMLHAKDGSRLKQQYVCVEEGKPVDRSEIVKGYEFAKDRYVVFTAEEIKALEEAGSRIIDITDFIPLASVDPVYFDHAYFLAPDKGGGKPYSLLAQALRETSRCAIGRWASHGREHIVLLRAVDGGLVMQQLHFAAEVRSIRELAIEEAPIKDPELKLAMRLIEEQASDVFDPSQFVDEVKQRVEAAIASKIEGKEITLAEDPREVPPNVVDLMDALRASLETMSRAPARKAERKGAVRAPASNAPRGRTPDHTAAAKAGSATNGSSNGAANAPSKAKSSAAGSRGSAPRSSRRQG